MANKDINAQIAELEQQRAELLAKAQHEAAEKEAKEIQQISELKESAKTLRKKAIESQNRGDEKNSNLFSQSAIDAEKEAEELEKKYQIEPQKVKKSSWGGFHVGSLILSFTVFFLIAAFCYFKFQSLGDEIRRHNTDIKTLMASNSDPALNEKLISEPYDLSSIQKMYYDKFVHLVDLSEIWFYFILFCPFVFVYLMPFFKKTPNVWKEYLEDLTPFQRQLILYLYLALFLLAMVAAKVNTH